MILKISFPKISLKAVLIYIHESFNKIAHTEIIIPLQKFFSLSIHCTVFGAFAKMRKATISFVISDCPQVTTRFPLDGFSWNFTLEHFFNNMSRKFNFLVFFLGTTPRCMNFMCRRYGTLCSIFMGRVNKKNARESTKRKNTNSRDG